MGKGYIGAYQEINISKAKVHMIEDFMKEHLPRPSAWHFLLARSSPASPKVDNTILLALNPTLIVEIVLNDFI